MRINDKAQCDVCGEKFEQKQMGLTVEFLGGQHKEIKVQESRYDVCWHDFLRALGIQDEKIVAKEEPKQITE